LPHHFRFWRAVSTLPPSPFSPSPPLSALLSSRPLLSTPGAAMPLSSSMRNTFAGRGGSGKYFAPAATHIFAPAMYVFIKAVVPCRCAFAA
jgi:hypothetical protein